MMRSAGEPAGETAGICAPILRPPLAEPKTEAKDWQIQSAAAAKHTPLNPGGAPVRAQDGLIFDISRRKRCARRHRKPFNRAAGFAKPTIRGGRQLARAGHMSNHPQIYRRRQDRNGFRVGSRGGREAGGKVGDAHSGTTHIIARTIAGHQGAGASAGDRHEGRNVAGPKPSAIFEGDERAMTRARRRRRQKFDSHTRQHHTELCDLAGRRRDFDTIESRFECQGLNRRDQAARLTGRRRQRRCGAGGLFGARRAGHYRQYKYTSPQIATRFGERCPPPGARVDFDSSTDRRIG